MDQTPNIEALALLEIEGIPTALKAQDAALKQAPVEIVAFAPVTPGKVVFIFAGDVASVEESLEVADVTAGSRRIDKLLLPGIHPSVVRAIHDHREPAQEGDALGMLELSSVAAGILAADAAIKCADVTILRIHPASGFGGKAFVTLSGYQADVEAAIDAAVDLTQEKTLDHEVIPMPHRDLNPNRFVRPWALDPAG